MQAFTPRNMASPDAQWGTPNSRLDIFQNWGHCKCWRRAVLASRAAKLKCSLQVTVFPQPCNLTGFTQYAGHKVPSQLPDAMMVGYTSAQIHDDLSRAVFYVFVHLWSHKQPTELWIGCVLPQIRIQHCILHTPMYFNAPPAKGMGDTLIQ